MAWSETQGTPAFQGRWTGRAASKVSRRGGEWNMDARGRESFQEEGIVINVTWCHLAHSIRTNTCLLGLESWKSSVTLMKAVLEAF